MAGSLEGFSDRDIYFRLCQVNVNAVIKGIWNWYSAIKAGTGNFFSGSYIELR